MTIHIGTAGFSYADWRGPFYPPGLPEDEWLAFYAREFAVVELNVTFYRLPGARTVAAWIERTPAGFLFSVKAPRRLTHERIDPTTTLAALADAVQPLARAGKLACVLAQFPQSFRPTPENTAYLSVIRQGLGELPGVVEFRHAAWATEAVFDQLRALGLGYAVVDEPRLPGLMPSTAVVTGPVSYIRFHGRNGAQWHRHSEAWQRYDYDYADEELREWTAPIRALAAKTRLTVVAFNNTPRAQAVADAKALRQMMA
jgi:uncharacterized protein YecE (DUF72 family)